MTGWTSKAHKGTSVLAPEWYVALKNSGASAQDLHKAVFTFCSESLPEEDVDDALVQLMIASYEA